MCWDDETYIHTANDDGHVATTSERDDRSVLVDHCGEPVWNTGGKKAGFSYPPAPASRGRNPLDEPCTFVLASGSPRTMLQADQGAAGRRSCAYDTRRVCCRGGRARSRRLHRPRRGMPRKSQRRQPLHHSHERGALGRMDNAGLESWYDRWCPYLELDDMLFIRAPLPKAILYISRRPM